MAAARVAPCFRAAVARAGDALSTSSTAGSSAEAIAFISRQSAESSIIAALLVQRAPQFVRQFRVQRFPRDLLADPDFRRGRKGVRVVEGGGGDVVMVG